MIRSRDQINKLRLDHEYLRSNFGYTWLLYICYAFQLPGHPFSLSPYLSLSFALFFLRTPYQRWYFRVLSTLYFWGCLFIFGGMLFVVPFSILYQYICTHACVYHIWTSQQLTQKPIGLVVYRFRDMIEMAKGQLKSFQDNRKLATELYFHFRNVISFNYVHGSNSISIVWVVWYCNFILYAVNMCVCVCQCICIRINWSTYTFIWFTYTLRERETIRFWLRYSVFWVIPTALWLLNIYLFRITELEKCTFKLLYIHRKCQLNPK